MTCETEGMPRCCTGKSYFDRLARGLEKVTRKGSSTRGTRSSQSNGQRDFGRRTRCQLLSGIRSALRYPTSSGSGSCFPAVLAHSGVHLLQVLLDRLGCESISCFICCSAQVALNATVLVHWLLFLPIKQHAASSSSSTVRCLHALPHFWADSTANPATVRHSEISL